jgi:hypothetical protein
MESEQPHKKKFRVGKAVLWGTGLASLPGIAKTIASPVKDLATDTSHGIKHRTPSLKDAKAAWNLDTQESPEDLFSAYARKAQLDEARRLHMLTQYRLFTLLGIAAMVGGLVLAWWNLSGVLLTAAAILFTLSCAYRRDSLQYQRLPTFGRWIRERMWWLFG